MEYKRHLLLELHFKWYNPYFKAFCGLYLLILLSIIFMIITEILFCLIVSAIFSGGMLFCLYKAFKWTPDNSDQDTVLKALRKDAINDWDNPDKKFAIMTFSQDTKVFFNDLELYLKLKKLGYNVLPIFNKNLAKVSPRNFIKKILSYYPSYKEAKEHGLKWTDLSNFTKNNFPKKKVDLLLISEHGSQNSIANFYALHSTEQLIADGGKIVLHSCFAAGGNNTEESIVAVIAQNNPNCDVYAPTESITHLHIEKNQISFKAADVPIKHLRYDGVNLTINTL